MFRILSLDGGGIRGAFAASFPARLEKELKVPTTDYFDLITDTSTGGIIALALGLGEPAARIEQFYAERAPTFLPDDHPFVCLSYSVPAFDLPSGRFPILMSPDT